MADTRYIKPYPALERHQAEMRALSRQKRQRLAIGGLLGLGVCLGAYLITPPLGLMLVGVLAMTLFFATIGGSSTVPAHELSGIEGEVRALASLKTLPDDCIVFNRIRLPDDWLPNGQRELDFIVVAPAGLFVIEVKNTSGRIHVDPNSKHWPLASRGCGGRPNWQAVANPLPQVLAQAHALERWLLRQGISQPVRSAVCFSRSDVILENVEASPVPVLIPEQIPALISEATSASILSEALRQNLIQALGSLTGTHSAPTIRAA
jgi:hypothetical protein